MGQNAFISRSIVLQHTVQSLWHESWYQKDQLAKCECKCKVDEWVSERVN